MKSEDFSKKPVNGGAPWFGLLPPAAAIGLVLVTLAILWAASSSTPGGRYAGCLAALGPTAPTGLANALGVVNILLLAWLIAQYVQMYLRVRSEFTLGLIILAYVLMAHALMTNSVIFPNLALHSAYNWSNILQTLLTTAAAGVLLYLNSR